MAIDNNDNHMMLVNLSNGVSNEDWTNMIDEMYNQEDELEIGPEEIVDLTQEVNPKAKGLRLSKIGFKTFADEHNKDSGKLL